MSTIGIFKNILDKKNRDIQEFLKGKPERIDDNLPLGLKINGMVTLDETKFIIHGDALKIQSPGGGNHTVLAIEKFMLSKLAVYRFYLESNDNKNQSILQVPLAEGEAGSIALYRIYDEVYPESEEEWGWWLNEHTGWIGYKDFIIRGDDGSETLYQRIWGGDGEYSKPLFFNSTLILDPYGMTGMRTENLAMAYGREISRNMREYVFLAQQKVLDDSGRIEEAKIVIMAGMDLNKAEVGVIG